MCSSTPPRQEREHETYYFAYCFPYTYSYLQRFLFALDSRGLPHLARETLCRTLQNRKCDRLTISSPANLRLDAAVRAGGPPPAAVGGAARPRAS